MTTVDVLSDEIVKDKDTQRLELAEQIVKAVRASGLPYTKASLRFGLSDSAVSKIMTGHVHMFSVKTLQNMVNNIPRLTRESAAEKMQKKNAVRATNWQSVVDDPKPTPAAVEPVQQVECPMLVRSALVNIATAHLSKDECVQLAKEALRLLPIWKAI